MSLILKIAAGVVLALLGLATCGAAVLGGAAAVSGCRGPACISLAEFEALADGMAYPEVAEIIGGDGILAGDVVVEGTGLRTVSYSWDGAGFPGANAQIMFQGPAGSELVIARSQAGLE